jgi:hypothetical protein
MGSVMEFLDSSVLIPLWGLPSAPPSPPHYIPRAHDAGEGQIVALTTS